MDTRYITPEAAVTYISLPSLRALYALVGRKQIPYTRIGRSLRFDKVKLDLWLERRAFQPGVKRGQRGLDQEVA